MPVQQLDESPRSLRPWIGRCFGIDPRTLAVFRMVIGVLLLVDLAIRISDLTAMYAADGVMPLDAVKAFFAGGRHWSIHWLNSSLEFQVLLFALAAACAMMLLLGIGTRCATIACWVLLTSLHNRGPLVINAGDTLMRLLLFWSMFLPLGRAWSLDARRRKDSAAAGAAGRRPVVSVASAAILLQVCLMYWFTAIFKFEAGWGSGSGLQNALEWGGYNKPLAEVLLNVPALMSALSIATVWLELIGPAMLFLPWRQARLRGLVIIAFWMLHAGIELTMHVGLFSYVSMAAWLLFIPGEFWSRFGRSENRAGEQFVEVETAAGGGGSALSKLAASAAQYVCAVLLGCVIACNIFSVLSRTHKQPIPAWLLPIRDVLMLHQEWSMFARPMNASGWLVAEAQLEDGSKVDVLRGGLPADHSLPAAIARLYPNHRWRKFCTNLVARHPNSAHRNEPQFPAFSQAFAKYLFRTWNASHPADRQIKVLKLICILQAIGPATGSEYGEFVDAVVESDHIDIEETIVWPEWQTTNDPDPRAESPDL